MNRSITFLCILVLAVLGSSAWGDLVQISFGYTEPDFWGNYYIGQDIGNWTITDETMITVTLDENWADYLNYSRGETNAYGENVRANARVNTDVANSSRTFQVRTDTMSQLTSYVNDMNNQYDYLFETIDNINHYNAEIDSYMGNITANQDRPHPEYMDKLAYWKKEKFETETTIDSLLQLAETQEGTGVPGWFAVYNPPPSN